MTVLREVLRELLSMFVADARLSAAILAVVALAALLLRIQPDQTLLAGAALLVGCLLVVVAGVLRAARARSRR
jgi:hypothetical protein